MGAGVIDVEVTHGLTFDKETGIGFEPFLEQPQYGEEYFNKYRCYSRTAFGVALNSLRVGLVSRYLGDGESLIDIGVGDGAFLRARGGVTWGYDINPLAQRMLMRDGYWTDLPFLDHIHAASFWDSLEHIEEPWTIIRKVQRFCFVSVPVFRDQNHILESRHYRPTEHCWYFTRYGLIQKFWDCGFACLEMNDMETALGREDIGTFVFQRRQR